jgi:predicted RNA-binding Zn ribbon-like protein
MLDAMDTAAPLLGEPVAVELMNTIWADREGVHDALDGPAEASAWLRAIRHAAESVITADASAPLPTLGDDLIDRLRTLRDALRRLAAEATSDPRSAANSPIADIATAVDELNNAAAAAPSWSRLHWPRRVKAPARTLHAAATADEALLSQIAENGIALFSENRSQLRACLGPGCILYFVKHHPRREWCSAACGNRARVARHYRRHHGDPKG